ncbi:B12-binding domain-containing radical SAM protein [Leptospira kirschneri]|uniref:B12-binding domain-containing radical SAM protein n=1 Tax=Leptospira kirschneri TaxID=29507 RepID=UPI0002D7F940|nr:B12-binding domain-containing radical SAM protein [Leptospira kirschneri]
MRSKILLYLVDLTHTGPVISSDVFPYGVAMVGAYLKAHHADEVEIEIFKFPNDLSAALEKRRPDIIGFSNYSWNFYLSYDFAERIKKRFPEIVIVFGGPNYGLSSLEKERFWKEYKKIDFYIVGEGEVSFTKLFLKLKEYSFNVSALKSAGEVLGSCDYLYEDKIICNELTPRVKSLTELPSPYLLGLMDKFWDTSLIPLIATTRGCPFTCAMCSEGASYYNKVVHNELFSQELAYIANHVKNTTILNLSDANFGMYRQDIDKAKVIAQFQLSHGYPKSLLTATGKNQKEKVIEVASLLNGAMVVFASLQSTDEEVLENIKRSNIKIESLKGVADATKIQDSTTVTELILGLPGDTIEKHKKSLKDTVDAGLGVVRMYQLIMLFQSELNTPENREKYKMETLYRIMPRSFGKYELFNEEFISVESEEICIATKSMPYKDHLDCREIDLVVEILHNGSPFLEYWYICDWLGYSWFDFLMQIYEQRNKFSPELKKLFDSFREDNKTGYWKSYQELKKHVILDFDKLINNSDGTNEMSKAKAKAFFLCRDELHSLMKEQMQILLKKRNVWDQIFELFLNELDEFIRIRKTNVLNYEEVYKKVFNFDFAALINIKKGTDPRKSKLSQPLEFEFYFDEKQIEIYQSYTRIYGKDSIDALGRLLMRTRMTDMFRKVRISGHADGKKNVKVSDSPETNMETYYSYS